MNWFLGDEVAAEAVVIHHFDDMGFVSTSDSLGKFIVINQNELGAIRVYEVGARKYANQFLCFRVTDGEESLLPKCLDLLLDDRDPDVGRKFGELV